MKKYLVLFFSICWSIIAFIKSWYNVELLDALFIFAFIPTFILMIGEIILFALSIRGIVKDKSYISIISLIILIAAGILIIVFPFEDVKFKYELKKYEKPRLEIVDMINNGKLKSKDENGNASLPNKYKKYSINGEVTIYQNDKNGQVIGFWIFRGMMSGSTELIYSNGGESLIKKMKQGTQSHKLSILKMIGIMLKQIIKR